MAKNILSLDHQEARAFLMGEERFESVEMPEYFNFKAILKLAEKNIGDTPFEDCVTDKRPETLKDINFDLLMNKDGKYAVRPLSLVNPFMYYFLVRELTTENAWTAIQECFSKYAVPHFESSALPVIPKKDEVFHKSTTILNWWNTIEQRSLELSLEYKYMFITDITNCYGSINPQSIDWAMSMANTKFETDANHGIAKQVMYYVRAMQHDRNIGIPQGSAVFDFIAEIVLGYADLQLSQELDRLEITGYEILRYRDDYRIFCNSKNTLEKISYTLQHVLEELNFRMNSSKTKIADSIVTDSIKPDKLYYINNTPIYNRRGCDFDGIQKYLLYILMFGRKFPNSGRLKVLLGDLDKRILKRLSPKEVYVSTKQKTSNYADEDGVSVAEQMQSPKKKKKVIQGRIVENIRAMSAVAVQIAVENVTVTHFALMVINRMVNSIKNEEERNDIITKVAAKLRDVPNSTYSELWLQNMTYNRDLKDKSCPYDNTLCKIVMGESDYLWNNEWLKDEYKEGYSVRGILSDEILKNLPPVIVIKQKFNPYQYDDMSRGAEYFEDDAMPFDEFIRLTNNKEE